VETDTIIEKVFDLFRNRHTYQRETILREFPLMYKFDVLKVLEAMKHAYLIDYQAMGELDQYVWFGFTSWKPYWYKNSAGTKRGILDRVLRIAKNRGYITEDEEYTLKGQEPPEDEDWDAWFNAMEEEAKRIGGI